MTVAGLTITKADFIAKGMQICHKYNVEIPAVGGAAHGDPASRNATQAAVINLLRQNPQLIPPLIAVWLLFASPGYLAARRRALMGATGALT